LKNWRQFLGLTVLITIVLVALAVWGPKDSVQTGAGRAEEMSYTLIIDPGHGGEDGGAQSANGLLESEINLSICQRMEMIAGLCGFQVIMTRESEEIEYPPEAKTVSERKVADQKNRVSIVNSTENAILISVHQNKYPDAKPRGSQVFYGPVALSKELGEYVHDQLILTLYPENRRVLAPISEDIFLMRQVNCPAILVECGFLSNSDEAELLATAPYQLRIATTIMGAYMQFVQDYIQGNVYEE
jgi:N-acetylmuramoyl-L-alanine amidase